MPRRIGVVQPLTWRATSSLVTLGESWPEGPQRGGTPQGDHSRAALPGRYRVRPSRAREGEVRWFVKKLHSLRRGEGDEPSVTVNATEPWANAQRPICGVAELVRVWWTSSFLTSREREGKVSQRIAVNETEVGRSVHTDRGSESCMSSNFFYRRFSLSNCRRSFLSIGISRV